MFTKNISNILFIFERHWFTNYFFYTVLLLYNRLGACEMVSMFLHKNRVTPLTTAKTQKLGDTEIPTKDVSDLLNCSSFLRKELQPIPLDEKIDVTEAKDICRRVVILNELEKRLIEDKTIE